MADITLLYVAPGAGDAGSGGGVPDALRRAAVLEVRVAGALSAARDQFDGAIDCVVTAYELPDGTGIDLLAHVRETAPDCPCVLYDDGDSGTIDTGGVEGEIIEYVPRGSGDGQRLASVVSDLLANRMQVAYPLPDDEDERLAALARYDPDDLSVTEAFGRLADLAVEHFGGRVAFVGLVDEREERFVACRGADWERLDREDTICTYTILEEDLMVVENVQEDPRFASVERLVELDIRSYAGATLTTPAGQTIGTFCLVDDEPRAYSERERTYLRLLADEAAEQLELRRRLVEAERGTESGRTESETEGGREGEF
jgi:CheY-like chemotaxis protein